jgi:hypothetical protein
VYIYRCVLKRTRAVPNTEHLMCSVQGRALQCRYAKRLDRFGKLVRPVSSGSLGSGGGGSVGVNASWVVLGLEYALKYRRDEGKTTGTM